MTQSKQHTIVRDYFGEIDVAYYEAEARRMRSEAVFSGLSTAFRFVSTRIAALLTAVQQWARDDSRAASRTA